MKKCSIIFLAMLSASTVFSKPENRKPMVTKKERIETMLGPIKASLEQVRVSSQLEQNNPVGEQNRIKAEIFLKELMVSIGKIELVNTMLPGLRSTCRDINIDLRGHDDLFIRLLVNTEFKTPTQIELNIEDIELNLATDYIAKNSIGECRGLFNLRDPILEKLLNHALKKGMGGINFLGNIFLDNLDQFPNL